MHLLSPTFLEAAAQSSPDWTTTLVPLIGIVAVFWFLLIRPQQKQQQKQRQMLATLRKGDQVVTQAGLYGKIHAIADREVVLEISNGVRVRWLKSQIAGVEKAEGSPETEKADKDEKKE